MKLVYDPNKPETSELIITLSCVFLPLGRWDEASV